MKDWWRSFLNFEIFSFGPYHFTPRHVLVFLLALAVTRILSGVLRVLVVRYERRNNLDRGSAMAVYQLSKYLLYILAIVFTLDLMGIKITLLLASSAALFVGIGLGLQATFNDIVCGVILLFERTIKVNDVLLINNEIGLVRKIGLRTSLIETREGFRVIVPNSKFVTDQVVNYTHFRHVARFDIAVHASYDSNVDMVRTLLRQCAASHKSVLKEPAPFVTLVDFGDRGLHFKLWFFTEDVFNVSLIRSDIRYEIYKKFTAHGISFSLPQRELYITQRNPSLEGETERS